MHLSIVCPTTFREGRGARTSGILVDLIANTGPGGGAVDAQPDMKSARARNYRYHDVSVLSCANHGVSN